MNDYNNDFFEELNKYITARLDIKNKGGVDNNIQILSNSDDNSKIFCEEWFKDETGTGLVVESIKSNLTLKIKCICDGELNISLKSKDIKDKFKHRFPIYIDFIKFKINNIPIIDNHTSVSHDIPYNFKMNVKNSDIINIYVEWLPFNDNCSIPSYDEITENNSDLINLKKEFNNYKTYVDKHLESYNFLFNKLFIDFKLYPNQLMDDLKSVCLELLLFVNNICKKYGLNWWLDYGTLIGAIRHENFVPWDDDIDIGMMRQDYNKLNEVILDEIKEVGLENLITLVYRERKIDDNIIGSFLQVLIFHKPADGGGKRLLLAGVDVFPYEYLVGYENMVELNKRYYRAEKRYYKNLSRNIDYDNCIVDYYDYLNCTYEPTSLIIPGVEGGIGPHDQYPLFVLDANKLFPLTFKKFSEEMLPCPNDSDYHLKLIYGDYMKVPKLIHHHGRVERFRYIKNTHEDFLKYTYILKKANEKYL